MSTKSSPSTRKKATTTAGIHRSRKVPVDLGQALVEAFLTNEHINQVLLDLLDPKIWRAQPPCSKRRNIATTFAHMHNVRCMRLAMSAKDTSPPRLTTAVKFATGRRADHAGTAAQTVGMGQTLEGERERMSSNHDVQNVGGDIFVATVLDPFGNVFGIIENPSFNIE